MIDPGFVLHPLGYCVGTPHQVMLCKGYNFWSGIAGSFLTSLPGWTIAGILFYRHHNCEERGCLRLGHAHPDHGRPVCRQHYHHDVAPQHLSLVPSVENDPAEDDSTPPDPVV